MSHYRAPIALFLQGTIEHRIILSRAAQCGFRSIVVPWEDCDYAGSGIRVRGGTKVSADGRFQPLPGVTLIRPALIAVLCSYKFARERGRRLAALSGAAWAHCDALAGGGEKSCSADRLQLTGREREAEAVNAEGVAYGVVESYPSAPDFVLGSTITFARLPDGDYSSAADQSDACPAHEVAVNRAFENILSSLNADGQPCSGIRPHLTIAPMALRSRGDADWVALDPLCIPTAEWEECAALEYAITDWLRHAHARITAPAPLSLSPPLSEHSSTEISSHLFPSLFGTLHYIETSFVPDASFAYLHPELAPSDVMPGEDTSSALSRLLCRRRSFGARDEDAEPTEPRLVETGVGRTCIVSGISLKSHPHFYDFTVLGVGLTPYSEGGFIEMGRTIDGKAALIRAWHRKMCAERLEREGCRTGRVVAIIQLPSERMDMPDGTSTPAALVVRGFRCALRVKQLDPIVCALHSAQHTPLVAAYLTERVHELRFELGFGHRSGLHHDEALAREIEMQGASQVSLRSLLAAPNPEDVSDDWVALLRRVRLQAIDEYSPGLLRLARRRLASELCRPTGSVDDTTYLRWFADNLGAQLSTWRRKRFLHDYHHPGVSRWQPGTLFSVGENNVSLLAEFPDLDTSLFVDDDQSYLVSTLQLEQADVDLLRKWFPIFHHREMLAAQTVVRTLASVMFRRDNEAIEDAVATFRRSYEDA